MSILELWLKALREGKYKQGSSYLCRIRDSGEEYCCLGVLCDILGIEKSKNDTDIFEIYSYEDMDAGLPFRVMREFCFLNCVGSGRNKNSLASLNDCSGYTFQEIANTIENNLNEYFRDGGKAISETQATQEMIERYNTRGTL